MRVLLDENVDQRLRRAFDSDFEVVTVRQRGWSGLKNGELLRLAAAEFDALVTLDQAIPHQQNVSALNLAVVVIHGRSNRRHDVEPAMPEVNRLLRTIQPGAVVDVPAR